MLSNIIKKSVEEIEALLSLNKSESEEETELKKSAEAGSEEVDTGEAKAEQSDEQETAKAAEEAEEDAEQEETTKEELKVEDVLKSLQDVMHNWASQVDALVESLKKKDEAVKILAKSITEVSTFVDNLSTKIEEVTGRLEKVEKTPVRKSVKVDAAQRFPGDSDKGKEMKKSLSPDEILDKLFNLVVEGKVSEAEFASFNAFKNVEVLSSNTKQLLGIN